ncbi:MAG TPA: IclR family transcriptional regulator [Mycobacteriales bacterium]|nr:IclR family transcriptional regulator [Mycobacteriales bacterium]
MSLSADSTDRDRGLLSSVQRALRVLDVVSTSPDGITAKAVARRADLKLSTTYHLLNTLVNEGYLVHLDEPRGFGLGYKIPTLYQRLHAKLDVIPEVASAVAAVHAMAGAAAYYANFRDTDIVIAHVVDSPQAPRLGPLSVGFHESAHATAFGKVMLAALTPGRRRDYLLSHGMGKLTPMTVTDRGELEIELEQARIDGVVAEIEELKLRFACLAAPVRDHRGKVTGAISVSVPAIEFEERRPALERAVIQGAEQTERALAVTGVYGH